MEKRYDQSGAEIAAQTLWNEKGTYAIENSRGKPYTIDTPPPTVSGALHIGHIFSYTQADIIARHKRMNGYAVLYPFGFDDNGLPTERFVEKKEDVRAHEMTRSEFIALCIRESKKAAEGFKQVWQKMGLSIDWTKTYSTISDRTRHISQLSFIELYKKGFVYRQHEPALYCTVCRTSVAQAELDDKQEETVFNNILFTDYQGNPITIATTRPELIPSCVAIVFNPHDTRYQYLEGTHVSVPLFNLQVPVYSDELVSIEKGSGLVMVCTFGDKNDIAWYKKFNLPYRQSIGNDGKCTKLAGFLEGMKVEQARQAIIEKLREHNLLTSQETISHAVSIHERCKKEIEFIILSQWFVKIIPYKKELLALADHVNWYPSFMKTRYIDWVTNLSWDWCISRQRFYGIPFPAWHCKDCNYIIIATPDQLPIDPQESHYNQSCPQCSSSHIVADTDVMDTWNTSSLTPYLCADLANHNQTFSFDDAQIKQFLPMSMRPQAHDIIRTWAFDTLLKVWMHNNEVPWKDIVISGHVLSGQKTKLSKKEGTNLVPEKLLAQYPADAIRYWTASGRLGQDTMFTPDQLKIGTRLITKLWNAFIFTQPHITQLENPAQKPNEIEMIDKWVLHQISLAQETYQKYMEQHEFSLALAVMEQFFWNDFCDNYLELIKNRLFNPELYTSNQVYSTQWTLYHVGLRVLQLFAPYLPHITETIYQELYIVHEKTASLHQTQFATELFRFPSGSHNIELVIKVVILVRKLKTERQLSLKTPLHIITITSSSQATIAALNEQGELLRGTTQAEQVICTISEESATTVQEINGQWHVHLVIE